MFKYATNFNQELNWNTSNVKHMCEMFEHATNFNQELNFNTSNVTNMSFIKFCNFYICQVCFIMLLNLIMNYYGILVMFMICPL